MAVHRKAYRFRLRPTRAQEQAMLRIAGARRFVWNWALARRKAYYTEHGKTIPTAQLSKELTVLRRTPETAWLAEIPRECNEQALRDLDRAFGDFFAGRFRHPRFRSKKRDQPTFRFHKYARIIDDKVVRYPRRSPARP
jgi:putative transposase